MSMFEGRDWNFEWWLEHVISRVQGHSLPNFNIIYQFEGILNILFDFGVLLQLKVQGATCQCSQSYRDRAPKIQILIPNLFLETAADYNYLSNHISWWWVSHDFYQQKDCSYKIMLLLSWIGIRATNLTRKRIWLVTSNKLTGMLWLKTPATDVKVKVRYNRIIEVALYVPWILQVIKQFSSFLKYASSLKKL